MLDAIVIKENWLTRPPQKRAAITTLLLVALLSAVSLLFLSDTFQAQKWLAASPDRVLTHHEYWRAWTALFIHASPLHLLSNLFLFAPLAYWLTGYFSLWLFPMAAFLVGGFTNLLVLKTMPLHTELLGVSGVVYWMGAAWLTLFLLIDRRHSFRRRLTTALSLVIVLMVPETYTPDVSYMSHLLGFIAGIACALAFYYFNRDKFLAAEVKEFIFTDDDDDVKSEEPAVFRVQ